MAAHGFIPRKGRGRVVRRLPGATQTIYHSASYFHNGTVASVQPSLAIEYPAVADLLLMNNLGRASPGISQPITFPAGPAVQGWMVYAVGDIDPVNNAMLPVLVEKTLPLCDDITDLDALVKAYFDDDPRIHFADAGVAAVIAGLVRQGRGGEARTVAEVRGRGVDALRQLWPNLAAELL